MMKLPPKGKLLWPVGVLALTCVLTVLAALQYKWTEEVNEAARDRMMDGLQSSMIGLREDLSRELLSIPVALQLDWNSGGLTTDPQYYIEHLEAWKRTTSHPDLVSDVFIADVSGGHVQLRRLNTSTHHFDSVNWPPHLAGLEAPLGRFSSIVTAFRRRFDAPPPGGQRRLERFGQKGGQSPPWVIDESVPALLGVEHDHSRHGRASQEEASPSVRWIIIQLNEDVLRRQLFPELAQRYFSSDNALIYDVAVISRAKPERVLYSSNQQFGADGNTLTDARLRLFGPPIGYPNPVRNFLFFNAPASGEPASNDRDRTAARPRGPLRLEPMSRDGTPGSDWELIAKHRKGSLEAALASTRRGHLAISFGVLAVLAVTMAMIIIASRRAHRLAALQMEFVAGVSHELRTPLAVIASAADNIADGIVEDRKKLARYGKVIRDQSRQLTQLVEHILMFAATRQDRYQYNVRSVAPAELVDVALKNSDELLREGGFTVERQIEPTPNVMVDAGAVTHCVQNLIANAVKYSGDNRWIGIRVQQSARDGREVQIAVEDKGIGIDPREQQRVFDAFYRSPAVIGAQIRGTGLGLALAKSIAEAMGGRISVTSNPGEGSTFILHLPCADGPGRGAEEPTSDEAVSTLRNS